MIELIDNIFNIFFDPLTGNVNSSIDALCITTNSVVNTQGLAVMGAGTAGEIARRFPKIKTVLGQTLKERGNVPSIIGYVDCVGQYFIPSQYSQIIGKPFAIWSFPTKTDFKNRSDLDLIAQSAKIIQEEAVARNYKRVLLPFPGIGIATGQLDKSTVREVINKILNDRFVVVSLN